MENIVNNGNKTIIRPIQSSHDDVSQQSVNNCINIAKFNALNKQLHNNCCNVNCPIANNTNSKCIANGSFNAKIMFIDAFPSQYETFTGCMTDEKGYLFEEALSHTKVKRSDIYCTTVLKCSDVSSVNESIVTNCLKCYLQKEVNLIKPEKVILTYSAFQALLKYQVIPYTGQINYFNKFRCTMFGGIEVDTYVIYDINQLNKDQRQTFKQGLQFILQ